MIGELQEINGKHDLMLNAFKSVKESKYSSLDKVPYIKSLEKFLANQSQYSSYYRAETIFAITEYLNGS